MKPEYIDLVDTLTLEPMDPAVQPSLLALACRTAHSGTRLIDNIVLGGVL